VKIENLGMFPPFRGPQAQLADLPVQDTVQLASSPDLSPLNRPSSPLVNSQNCSLKTLGGQPDARKSLQTLVDQLSQNHKAWPLLVQGNSGVGKTTLLRGLAGDLQQYNIATLGAQANDLSQQGAAGLQALFAQANQLAAQSSHGVSVLAMEDLDLIARVRSTESDQASTRQHQLLAALCQSMKENPGVLVVATTSREMESIKPKPPAIYDPVSDKMVTH